MRALLQDLRYGWRMLLGSPGFTAVAVLTLALGIGANTAIFSVVKAVMLRPLPFSGPDRLVHIQIAARSNGARRDWSAYRDIADWRERGHSFESVGSYRFSLLNLTGDAALIALYGSAISWKLFPTLGVQPALGRNFLPSEDLPATSHVILLSDGLWRGRFAADTGIVGRKIRMTGQASEDYVVTGVMPPGFNFPLSIPSAVNVPTRQMAFWVPIGVDAARESRDGRKGMAVARLKRGVTAAQAEAELDSIAAQLEREYPRTNAGRGVRLVSPRDCVLGDARPAMLLLLGSIGLVLLIACGNIANLLLARAVNRKRETAIRLAVGATPGRLARQWITESLLLALIGGCAGLLLAWWSLRPLLSLAPEDIPRLYETRIDTGALAFTVCLSLLAGLLFGVLPAWSAASARETSRAPGSHARDVLIVLEVALALILNACAGLLIRSLGHLLNQDPGFDADQVLTSVIVLPGSRYHTNASYVDFFNKLLDRVKDLPGVESAGAVNGVPLSGNIDGAYVTVECREGAREGEDRPAAEVFSVSPDYLRTMGIALVQGRELTRQDRTSGFHAMLINEAAGRQFWPGRDPMGKRLSVDAADSHLIWRQVVGIVKNTHDHALERQVQPAVYVPMEQGHDVPQFLCVRTQVPAAGFAPILRAAVAAVDKDQPVFVATSMRDLVDDSIARRRFSMRMLTGFGALALILAALGIYGVVSYTEGRRAQEIGLRMALGAQRGDVLKLVVGRGMAMTLAGVVTGLIGAAVLTRLLSGLLYEVRPADPATFAAVSITLAVVAFAACYLPARQALQIDPMTALRRE